MFAKVSDHIIYAAAFIDLIDGQIISKSCVV